MTTNAAQPSASNSSDTVLCRVDVHWSTWSVNDTPKDLIQNVQAQAETNAPIQALLANLDAQNWKFSGHTVHADEEEGTRDLFMHFTKEFADEDYADSGRVTLNANPVIAGGFFYNVNRENPNGPDYDWSNEL